jgi:hypothetical protein
VVIVRGPNLRCVTLQAVGRCGAQRPKAVELATCRQPWTWATLGWGWWPVIAVLWQSEHRAVTG